MVGQIQYCTTEMGTIEKQMLARFTHAHLSIKNAKTGKKPTLKFQVCLGSNR